MTFPLKQLLKYYCGHWHVQKLSASFPSYPSYSLSLPPSVNKAITVPFENTRAAITQSLQYCGWVTTKLFFPSPFITFPSTFYFQYTPRKSYHFCHISHITFWLKGHKAIAVRKKNTQDFEELPYTYLKAKDVTTVLSMLIFHKNMHQGRAEIF